ncbi:MAG: response regulator transcription factor [Candidatus Omnitrophica bacterium]|nr:response regulator transcription factor [Candidatus Omnitrophota bacterium]
MANKMILMVEDDAHISKLVKYNLEKAGFQCIVSTMGEDAFDILKEYSIDLIILDIMLPEIDGFEVCKRIKQHKKWMNIPVLMLTAKGEEIDRIIGFELGADDYIVKPFSPRELVLRVKAVLRRGQNQNLDKEILAYKDLVIDIPRHKITLKNKEIKLTAMEFKLLKTLIERVGRVQSRERLLDEVWELGADVTTRTVDTHIKRVRQKIGSYSQYIETVRGHGYRVVEE